MTALKALLSAQFTDAKVLLDWPSPHIKLKIPAIVLMSGQSSLTRFTPETVQAVSENDFFQNNGQFETTVKLHYFARNRASQYQFTKDLFDFFSKQSAVGEQISPNIQFDYGPRPFEKASASVVGFMYLNEPVLLKQGEIRTEWTLLVDSPSILRVSLPLARDIQLINKGISEKEKI